MDDSLMMSLLRTECSALRSSHVSGICLLGITLADPKEIATRLLWLAACRHWRSTSVDTTIAISATNGPKLGTVSDYLAPHTGALADSKVAARGFVRRLDAMRHGDLDLLFEFLGTKFAI